MDVFISQILNGINVSSLLLISALGLAIIFGLMKVINMAHGELIMIGAYSMYFVTTVLGAPFLVGMLFAFVITGVIGLLIELIVIKRLYSKPTETLLATYAISVIFQQIVRTIFSPELRYVKMPIEGNFNIGTIVIPYFNIFVIAISIFMVIITWLLFYKTNFGKKIRAITQNREMVECLGIKTSRVDTWTFAYGAGLAGLAGAVLAPIKSVSPTMGNQYLTDSFMTVVVGGVNSLFGTAAGSGIVGESTTIIAGMENEITAKLLVFLMVIVIIRFKPEGLFVTERR